MRLSSEGEPVIWVPILRGKRFAEEVEATEEPKAPSGGPRLLGRTGDVDLSRDT